MLLLQYSHLRFYSTTFKMGLFRSEGMVCRWSHKSSNTGNGDYHNYFATLQVANGITPEGQPLVHSTQCKFSERIWVSTNALMICLIIAFTAPQKQHE